LSFVKVIVIKIIS